MQREEHPALEASMSRSTFHLTSEERAELEAALHRTHHAGTWRRTRALLLLDEGERMSDVAHLLGVHRQAVHRWRTLYEHERSPASLQERVSSGRPPAQRRAADEAIARLLETDPRKLGYRTTAWTVPLLQRHLREAEGHEVSGSTLRRALHGLGYRWKRPRFVLARRDPEREGKKAGAL